MKHSMLSTLAASRMVGLRKHASVTLQEAHKGWEHLGGVQDGERERERVLPAAQVAQRAQPLLPRQQPAAAHACVAAAPAPTLEVNIMQSPIAVVCQASMVRALACKEKE
jgi:hypothetical protein